MSFTAPLAQQVKEAADASERTLRRKAAREALLAYEAEHGVITEEELEAESAPQSTPTGSTQDAR